MQGHVLAFSGKEIHSITERDVKRTRGENPAQALLFPLGLSSASFSFFSMKKSCSESVYMGSELVQESTSAYDIIICLIQTTAWLSTMLVLSSSGWYKMAMLFLEFLGFFLFWHILIIKVTFKRKVGYR